MAVPKRRHSNARSGKRRAHHSKKPRQVQTCPKCSSPVLSHHVCQKCGYYMGRTVVQMSEE
ncbi:MAG: 50S ribosomal protein L32 [Pirellula sp.]|nr:50S ribosomal protein L32 [Pirellula sp.]MCY3011595.1 50S ribosomal protein L32 [Planctomycetota bacterium]